jgi:hypothetical protein
MVPCRGSTRDADRPRRHAGLGVDPHHGAGTVGRRPHRAVRGGYAARIPARPGHAHDPAGTGVDPCHRAGVLTGHPQAAHAEQDVTRPAGHADRLGHRVSPGIDPGHRAVGRIEHPDLTAAGGDAAGVRADRDGRGDRVPCGVDADHQPGAGSAAQREPAAAATSLGRARNGTVACTAPLPGETSASRLAFRVMAVAACRRVARGLAGRGRTGGRRLALRPALRPGLSRWQLQRRVMVEDGPLELSQLRARLDRQFFDQQRPGRAVAVEGVRLTAAAVQREHQLPAEPLVQRMLGDKPLELGAQRGMPSDRQVRLDPVLDQPQPQRLEALCLRPGEGFRLQVGERAAAPQRLGLPQQCRRPGRVAVRERLPARGGQVIVPVQVQFAVGDMEHVPGRPGPQPWLSRVLGLGKRLAQPGDMDPQHPFGRTRGLIAEQLIDQLVTGDDPVRVAQQQREQRPLPRPADPHRRRAVLDLQRPEDPERQTSAHADPPSEVSS